jgi:hypothetical protein
VRVDFHPRKNLLLGRNHTGKSTVIRMLFETLGAMPVGKLLKWNPGTVSLVQFAVDEKRYFALRQLSSRALFDGDMKLIVSTSRMSQWSREFGRVAGFNLVFSDRDSDVIAAEPSCFFLPFYINQDGSWYSEWNTFNGMRRFGAPWGLILEYFTGISPPEYYLAKAERDKAAKELEEQSREARLLDRARERFSKTLALSGPK